MASDLCPHCKRRSVCDDLYEKKIIHGCGDYISLTNKQPRVYQITKTAMTLTQLKDRAGWNDWDFSRLGPCECGSVDYIILPTWSEAVREGGKDYLICAHCGGSGMHL